MPADKSFFQIDTQAKIPLYHQVNIFQYGVFTVTLCKLFGLNDNIPRAGCIRETKIKGGKIFELYLNPVHFFQLFDPGLNLYGLGGLVPETLDKLLRIIYHLLLVAIGGQLLFAPFLAEDPEF